MRKIILFCEENELSFISYHSEFEKDFPDSMVIVCENTSDAMEQLSVMRFDLIISGCGIDDDIPLFQYTEDEAIDIPFILYTSRTKGRFKDIQSNRFYYRNKNIYWKNEVRNLINKFLL